MSALTVRHSCSSWCCERARGAGGVMITMHVSHTNRRKPVWGGRGRVQEDRQVKVSDV